MASRVVFGVATPLISYLDTRPGFLEKVLNHFDNKILVSTKWITKPLVERLYAIVGKDRLYLDSGGFNLYKDQVKFGPDSKEFKSRCESTKRRFLDLLRAAEYDEVFELDNEYFRVDGDMASPRNYLRQEIKDICGFYPTPVFKMFQGFGYWKQLCDSPLYPKLSIGGLAQTRSWHVYRDELRKMMDYARMKGKKVHLLGCSNVETCREVLPDTLDYNIMRFAINLDELKREHPEKTKWTHDDYKFPLAVKAVAHAICNLYLYDERINDNE